MYYIPETSLNALALSIINGNVAMTECLLRHGSELQNDSAKPPCDDSLCLIFYLHSSSETISMLVEQYDKNSSAACHDDVLYYAMENGVESAIKLIPSLPKSVLLTQGKRAWDVYIHQFSLLAAQKLPAQKLRFCSRRELISITRVVEAK